MKNFKRKKKFKIIHRKNDSKIVFCADNSSWNELINYPMGLANV